MRRGGYSASRRSPPRPVQGGWTGAIAAEFRRTIADLPAALKREDDQLREAARSALRKAVGKRLRKRPMVEVHLLRL